MGNLEDCMTQVETEWGPLIHLKPDVKLSKTPPKWIKPPVPLGFHEPKW